MDNYDASNVSMQASVILNQQVGQREGEIAKLRVEIEELTSKLALATSTTESGLVAPNLSRAVTNQSYIANWIWYCILSATVIVTVIIMLAAFWIFNRYQQQHQKWNQELKSVVNVPKQPEVPAILSNRRFIRNVPVIQPKV